MKHRFAACAAALLAFLPTGLVAAEEPLNLPGWKLIWNDEFSGTAIDRTKWTVCERGKSDWDDTMSADPRCYALKDGILQLRGIPNDRKDKDPVDYLTGGLNSRGKFDVKHGKVVIRARCKSAKGAWPALWMLGSKGAYPHNGEIDLMEHLNHENIVYQTVHSDWTLNVDKKSRHGGTAKINRDDFNTYGAEWDADKITFTVNGAPTYTYPRVAAKGPRQWPFDGKFYLLLTMQIGGSWVGAVDPKQYPAWMEIDWVRVYQPVR